MTMFRLLGSRCCAQLFVGLVMMAAPGSAQVAAPREPGGSGTAAAVVGSPTPTAPTGNEASAPQAGAAAQQGGKQPAATEAGKLEWSAGYPLIVRAGQGSTAFTLKNSTGAAVSVSLTPGPIADAGSHAALTGAKVVLGLPTTAAPAVTVAAATPFLATVPAGQELSVQANVSGVTGASSAVLPIFNGTAPLGEIPLFVQDAPLNIAVDGPGSSSAPMIYGYEEPVRLALKNSDAESYLLHWEFQIGGRTLSQSDVKIPANGSARIELKNSCTHFWQARLEPCRVYGLFDWVHPTALNGTLVLTEMSGGMHELDGLLPSRAVPVSLRMYRLGELATELWTYGWVVLFLTMGGFLSYLASSVLPNTQRKADLRAQLHDLANRTSMVSTRVDSYLRVLLRLERSRIADGLDSASPWIPASTDPFAQIPAAIDTLNKRLTAAERLDQLSRKHDSISTTAPPSVTDSIDMILQEAADQLHSAALSDAEVAAATAALNKAQAALDMLDDSDALAKLIAGNLEALQTRIDKFPASYYEDLRQALPGIFVVLDGKFKDPKNIVRPMLFAIDHGVAAMRLVLDYAMVRASIPTLEGVTEAAPAEGEQAAPNMAAMSVMHCAGLGDNTRKRLADRQCVLIELLGKLSWQGLRDANLLVQQMRQDIYEEDVIAEMSKPCQAEITTDTQKTRPYLPVFLTVTFKEPRFNRAAALERMICRWKFPDHLEEQCWGVCHYFTGRERDSGPEPPPRTQNDCGPYESAPEPTEEVLPPRSLRGFGWFHAALVRMHIVRPRRHPAIKRLWVSATIRGQNSKESDPVPIPPLRAVVKLQPPPAAERSRAGAELIRFLIAMGVAIAGLLSGALEQLQKLEFLPATIAILGLGFSANSVKNLLTQSTTPATPPKVTSR